METFGARDGGRFYSDEDVEAQGAAAMISSRNSHRQKPRSKRIQDVEMASMKMLMMNRGKEPAIQDWGYMTTPTFIKLVAMLVGIYNAGRRWMFEYDYSENAMNGSTIACATTVLTQLLISGSSFLGGAMFVSIACCILSKCYATRYFLHHSWLALIVSFEPSHDLHTYFGAFTVYAALLHSVLHIARYVLESSADLMYSHVVNRSGFMALFFLLPTALPMMYGCFKTKMTFEVRKALHMLFLPFTIALCFHSPALRVVCSILLVWYILDRLYFTTRMTFLIERPTYKSVGRGTLVRIELPSGYQFNVGSYAQVNCPAISASEWHPFSLFPVPGPGNRAGFHIEAIGDWSHELFRLGLESPQMPLWITAAQPSAMETSIYFENVLLVCTGAGITPAVSAADRFGKRKNIHLLWMTREASMVALFEKQLRRVKSTVHLTGKPSERTKRAMLELFAHSPVQSERDGRGRRQQASLDFSEIEGGMGSSERNLGNNGQGRQDDGSDDDADPNRGAGERHQVKRYRSRSSDRRVIRDGRAKNYHPVAISFGRPDIGRFISDTVQDTPPPTPDWSEVDLNERRTTRRPVRMAQVIERLNTGQRLSKHDLMAADAELVHSASKRNLSAGVSVNDTSDVDASDPGPMWLVLYCGANGAVERVLSSVCDELRVTWRREYFSTW